MIVLTIALCIMTLGYAALQEKINITGGASVDSVYRVEITKVEQTSITGSAEVKEAPSYTGLTANFNVGLTTSSDSITYNIEISNLGTVDVRLNNAVITTEGSSKIKVTKSGIANGDILLAGESKTMAVKISYTGNETSEITGNININLEYTRLKSGTGEVVEEGYTAYSIGDTITFAGSNWYVIKNSDSTEDYVTLMKETILTHEELGDYGIDYTCTAANVTSGGYGCTTEGEIKEFDTMAYYLSDTCSMSDISGCDNDCKKSKINEMLENQYLPTLGSDNLKEVDGYQIRLITVDELKNNLGWINANDNEEIDTNATDSGNNVPTWIYQNFGDTDNKNVKGYWTMTPYPNYSSGEWCVSKSGALTGFYVPSFFFGVRPVINLLKSSIG